MSKYFTMKQYMDADCMQFEVPVLGLALFQITEGKMCEDCPKNGHCDSYDKMNSIKQSQQVVYAAITETVREEAARREISIKQVRRERREQHTKILNDALKGDIT